MNQALRLTIFLFFVAILFIGTIHLVRNQATIHQLLPGSEATITLNKDAEINGTVIPKGTSFPVLTLTGMNGTRSDMMVAHSESPLTYNGQVIADQFKVMGDALPENTAQDLKDARLITFGGQVLTLSATLQIKSEVFNLSTPFWMPPLNTY